MQVLFSGNLTTVNYPKIPVRGTSVWTYMHRWQLPPLLTGDIVICMSSVHCTNDELRAIDKSAAAALEIRLALTGGHDRDGLNICNPGGRNITPKMHHDRVEANVIYTLLQDMPEGRWLKSLITAQSTTNADLAIDQHLCPGSCLVLRP